jgi:hypothetical protein
VCGEHKRKHTRTRWKRTQQPCQLRLGLCADSLMMCCVLHTDDAFTCVNTPRAKLRTHASLKLCDSTHLNCLATNCRRRGVAVSVPATDPGVPVPKLPHIQQPLHLLFGEAETKKQACYKEPLRKQLRCEGAP